MAADWLLHKQVCLLDCVDVLLSDGCLFLLTVRSVCDAVFSVNSVLCYSVLIRYGLAVEINDLGLLISIIPYCS
jgi:hypothetical protein